MKKKKYIIVAVIAIVLLYGIGSGVWKQENASDSSNSLAQQTEYKNISQEMYQFINNQLNKINSPQYPERLEFKEVKDNQVIYTCGSSNVIIEVVNKKVKSVTVENDKLLFLLLAVSKHQSFDIPDTLSEKENAVLFNLVDDSFTTKTATITSIKNSRVIFAIK